MTPLLLASLLFASDPAVAPDAAVEPPVVRVGAVFGMEGRKILVDAGGLPLDRATGWWEFKDDEDGRVSVVVRAGASRRQPETAALLECRVRLVGWKCGRCFAAAALLWEDGP